MKTRSMFPNDLLPTRFGAQPAGSSASGTIVPLGTVGQRRHISLTVPAPDNPAAPLEVLVTAVSSRPYAKTLQGRFVILPAISCVWRITAARPWLP